jgi:uncharacterized protein YyaL (SSP411 family)
VPLAPENLLAAETSPYLHQHKDNPVHWRAWSRAALDEARELDRPILLSIGYAACHWCHVMAHESFEDRATAEVMNRLYTNIKVDREERPDIDQIYMAALTATGEQGGWPLTMFLTPDAKPFWGGTYFPDTPRYGRPGFVQVLESVHRAWTEKRDDLDRSADALTRHVHSSLAATSAGPSEDREILGELANGVHGMIDLRKGGVRGAPKFPNAPFMRTLWQSWLSAGNAQHRDAVLLSLQKMLAGGIYDHIGGGLSRYSTDEDWLVPHFEKMLYDNAQLVQLCCWAHAETGDDLFRLRIEETVGWLLRDMRTPNGAFASSLDADSEGEEGRYYCWDRSEVESILADGAEAFFELYVLDKPPHWEGKLILHLRDDRVDPLLLRSENMELARRRLLNARHSRVPPSRDDKNLTDWNALTIAALAVAGRQLSRPNWIDAAERAFAVIEGSAATDGRLPHSVLGDRRLFPALSTDLSAMATAATRLYEVTGKASYLASAKHNLDILDLWYRDDTGNGYFLTASDSPDSPMRIRGDVDEAVPSATAQIVEALALAGAEQAIAVAENAAGRALAMRHGQAGIVNACDLAYNPVKLITIDEPFSTRFADIGARYPNPRRSDFPLGLGAETTTALPYGVLPDTTRAGAWLCTGMICLPFIDDPNELAMALRPGTAS